MSTAAVFVMFDLDGTLVDSSALYLTGVPLIVGRHLGHEIQVEDYMDLWGHDVRAWFTRAAGGDAPAVVDAMYADFEAFYIARHHECPAYAGVGEGLRALKDDGHTLGVVTTRPQRRAELVRQYSWAATLDFVIGGDRVARRKPYPDALNLAVEEHRDGTVAGRNVYVGDNALDIHAARASCHSIVGVAALWGARDRPALIAAHPDSRFETFAGCALWLSNHEERLWVQPSSPM